MSGRPGLSFESALAVKSHSIADTVNWPLRAGQTQRIGTGTTIGGAMLPSKSMCSFELFTGAEPTGVNGT